MEDEGDEADIPAINNSTKKPLTDTDGSCAAVREIEIIRKVRQETVRHDEIR